MSDRILEVGSESKRGIYAPVTREGTLVVNGLVVSCYSAVEHQQVQKSVHDILHWFMGKFGLLSDGNQWQLQKETPLVLRILLQFAELVFPPSYVF